MSELPNGWIETTFDDGCAKISDGTHHSPKEQYDEPADGLYKYVTAKNIRMAGLDLGNLTYVPEKVHREIYNRCNPELGDVLLTKDGVNAGDVAINTLEEEFSLLSSVALLKPNRELLDPKYLRYFIESPEGTKRLTGEMRGAAIRRIILRSIKAASVPIAPLPEQRRIVARIEELFSRLDAGVAALRHAKAQLQRYRQSVLAAAVTGQLTQAWREQHPDTEPAEELLNRILEARREQWNGKGKYKEPASHAANHVPEIPEEWTWAGMRQVGEVQLGRQRAPQHHSGVHMRPYLRVANVFEDRLNLTDVKSMNFTPEEFERYHLRFGDILLNEGQTPELVGRPAMYREEIPECCYQKTLHRFRAFEGVLPQYALMVFRAYMHNGRFTSAASITTNIAHLTQRKFVEIEFPLAPLAEQHQIVAEVEARTTAIDHLEAELDRQITRSNRLRQSTLAAAFSGKLRQGES